MRVCLFILVLQAAFSVAQAQDAKWYDRITASGDVRIRHDYQKKSEQDRDSHRERIRARVKFEGQVEDNLKAAIQLASGTGQAVSTNQSLEDGYTEKGVYVAQAYLDYAPSESLNILGGKVKNTLYSPGDSELLFDADLNPEGTTFNYRHKFENASQIFANAGMYWYDERDSGTTAPLTDTNQYSAQIGTSLALGDDTLVVGIGHHGFSPIKGYTALGVGAVGNSVTGGNYDEKYQISEAFVSYAMKMGLTVYAHYAKNDEVSDEDTAYLAGIMYGKTKVKGDWSVGYSYRATEKDAVLGAIKDSDFANGETDTRGHKLGAKYQLGSATTIGLTYFVTERNVSDTGSASLTKTEDYQRALVDLIASF